MVFVPCCLARQEHVARGGFDPVDATALHPKILRLLARNVTVPGVLRVAVMVWVPDFLGVDVIVTVTIEIPSATVIDIACVTE